MSLAISKRRRKASPSLGAKADGGWALLGTSHLSEAVLSGEREIVEVLVKSTGESA